MTSTLRYLRRLTNSRLFKKIFFSSNDPSDRSNPYDHPVEKAIRLLVHVVAVVGMLAMILDVTMSFRSSPTVTTAETDRYPVQSIDFPAIAICSINKISKRAAIDLAEELLEFETTTYNANLTVSDLVEMIRLLGNLYLFELHDRDVERLNLLHRILERGYNGYDVPRIMKRLTPRCRSILRRCSWEGKDKVCDDIFFLRRTGDGFCCTFNYVRRNDGIGSSQIGVLATQEVEHITNIGSEYGLSVLLNPQLDDYAYQILPSQGFKVLVYSSFDYPDSTSGGLKEVLIPPKTENFLDMDAVTFYSVPEVQKYDIEKRDCLFSTEQSKVFHGHYSFGDCIVHCRTKDILQLCNCVPFFYPTTDDAPTARVCNLKDLPCLKTYKEKWLSLKPRFESNMYPFDDHVFEGKSGYLNCDCFPSCQDISYYVSFSNIPLSLSELSWGRTKFVMKDHSVVHVFFGKSGTIRLRQDVLFYWYELMSNYGGICSLFLGVSIINLIEIFYNCVLAVWRPRRRRIVVSEVKEKSEEELDPPSSTSESKGLEETSILYWNEIARSVNHKEFDLSNLPVKRQKF